MLGAARPDGRREVGLPGVEPDLHRVDSRLLGRRRLLRGEGQGLHEHALPLPVPEILDRVVAGPVRAAEGHDPFEAALGRVSGGNASVSGRVARHGCRPLSFAELLVRTLPKLRRQVHPQPFPMTHELGGRGADLPRRSPFRLISGLERTPARTGGCAPRRRARRSCGRSEGRPAAENGPLRGRARPNGPGSGGWGSAGGASAPPAVRARRLHPPRRRCRWRRWIRRSRARPRSRRSPPPFRAARGAGGR